MSQTLICLLFCGKQMNCATELIDVLQSQVKYWKHSKMSETQGKKKEKMVKKTMKKFHVDRQTMRDVMAEHVFSKMKFSDHDQIHSITKGSVGATIMTHMRVDESHWAEFWAQGHIVAEALLGEHKTHSASKMKKSFNKGEL